MEVERERAYSAEELTGRCRGRRFLWIEAPPGRDGRRVWADCAGLNRRNHGVGDLSIMRGRIGEVRG